MGNSWQRSWQPRALVAGGIVMAAIAGALAAGAVGGRSHPHPAVPASLGPLHPPTRPLSAPKLPPSRDLLWWRMASVELHHPGYQGLNLAVDLQHRPSVIVFVYHQVCPADWPLRNGPDFITPGRLAADFRFFRTHHIRTLTSSQFLSFVQGRARVPSGSVFLTFDNGLEGVYRYAYPIARRYGVHITTFVIGDRVGTVWRPGEKYLGWNQLRAMQRSGLVGIQSESYDLHAYETTARRSFGPAMLRQWETYPSGHWETYPHYAARVRFAFMQQRAVFLRHLGTPPTLLVWPFSTYTRVAQMEARAAGYRLAFAVYPGLVTQGDVADSYALPRNPATFMWDNVPAEYLALRSNDWKAILPLTNTTLVAGALRGVVNREPDLGARAKADTGSV